MNKKVVKNLCRWLKIFVGVFREGKFRLGVSDLSSPLSSSPLPSSQYYSMRHELEKRKQGSSSWRTQICQTNWMSKIVKNIKDLCRNFSRRKLDWEFRIFLLFFFPISFHTPRIRSSVEKRWTQFRNPRNKAWRVSRGRDEYRSNCWNESNEQDGC